MTYTISKYHGSYNRNIRTSKIKYIVIHYTAGTGSARNNCIYFSGGNRNASAHYFIDNTSIYEYANPTTYITWHCGDGNGRFGITNQNSIGIEVVMNGNKPFTEEEIKRLAWLVQKLMKDYGIAADHVVRHYDASRKQCPLYYVKNTAEWKKLHARITGATDAVPATSNNSSSIGGNTVNITLNVLQKGSKGNQVKTLQRLLVSLGYGVGSYGADGVFGNDTVSAVKKFQKAKKLTQDGVVGTKTWNALLK